LAGGDDNSHCGNCTAPVGVTTPPPIVDNNNNNNKNISVRVLIVECLYQRHMRALPGCAAKDDRSHD
jgi:hypothetical protein